MCNKLSLNAPNSYYVMAGDLNARHICWGDSVTKRKGILLKRWLDNDGVCFRARIIPPDTATYSNAFPLPFLDLCIIDNRLRITDTMNDRIITADYNSDHKALMFTIALNDTIHLTDPSLKYRLMYKKTKWKKFEKTLNNSYENNIPFDRNHTNDEIDSHIGKIDDNTLLATIETVVPKYKPQDDTLNYIPDLHPQQSSQKTFPKRPLDPKY